MISRVARNPEGTSPCFANSPEKKTTKRIARYIQLLYDTTNVMKTVFKPTVSRPSSRPDLAGIFEEMMQQLTLLGHTLPKSAGALTPSQLKILFTLDFLGVPTPMSRLSAKLSVTPGTLTRVASGLRRKGYLERRRSAADDRVVNLSLTNRGQRAVGRIKKYRGEFFANLCTTLSHADCQRLIESHRYILETYRRILQQKRGEGQI
jgi:DNA-binding MarR family transcriptional regulator